MSPNQNHEPIVRKLDHALGSLGNVKVLIGGDFNAWARLWGAAQDTARGNDVALWTASRGLMLLNRIECGPTFINHNGSSYIDLTFVSSDWDDIAVDWSSDFETGSDHSLIAIRIRSQRDETNSVTPAARFNTRKGNWRDFCAEQKSLLVDYELTSPVEDENVSVAAAELDQVLVQAAQMIRALRRRQRCRDPALIPGLERNFCIARRDFKNAVRQSKRVSWRK
ncbi:unnamed protein product [Nesidiocoris tenuis]|uniref:Endonuclease/exonuclease/phosphatase domain-containing protein n=1 Tax=Nesidiocoris tenuis TaxID=355587 RepID=A0A6H5HHD5_9HEMI|nr:unnamed protein product [Nesidiocoris tenuis]